MVAFCAIALLFLILLHLFCCCCECYLTICLYFTGACCPTMTRNLGSILWCFSLSRTWTEPPKLEVPQQQSDTWATKTKMNFKLWLHFFANRRRFIETITQLTFLHSQFDAVPKNDFPAARPSRTMSALQTKSVTSSHRLQTAALLHNASITRRLHSTSRFKYDTLLFQQTNVENRGEIKQSNGDIILTVKVQNSL